MVVLILDVECLGLDFALRCAAAGHQVFWFRHSPKKPVRDGEGFEGITIISEWQSYMPKARDGLIVVTGNCALLSSIDRYRQDFGYKVFGPTVASAKLEIERGAGMKVMEAAGLELPPYKMFDSLEDAEKFARKSDRAWVHKPMGDTPDKDLTFVSKDPGDLCGWLRRQIKSGKQLKGQCMLQEKLDMLCEYGVSGWFGSDGFLPGRWGTSWEHKKLFPGEIGPNTGEMGTLGQYMEEEKLATECLEPLAAAFAATGHTGDASIGVGIDNKGKAWPFELTMRLGYPAWYLQMASHKGDPAKWMRSLLDGKDDLRVSDDVCIAVVCAHPRWPYDSSTPAMVEGDPISGLDEVWGDIHPAAVMKGKGPVFRDGKVVEEMIHLVSGEYTLIVTGLGKTISRAQKRVYGTIDKINFPGMMFRNDIGDKVAKVIDKMHGFGYALDTQK